MRSLFRSADSSPRKAFTPCRLRYGGQFSARPRILLIGCGDIGLRLLPLLTQRYRVFALTRQGTGSQQAQQIRVRHGIPIVGDLDQPRSLRRIAKLANRVIHLAPPPNQGNNDPRTQHLLRQLRQIPFTQPPRRILSRTPQAPRLLYLSTSGVYGNCAGAKIDETQTVRPQTARAIRRVAAEKIVRQLGKNGRWQTAILRVPGIYAANRLPLDRLRAGTPALLDTEDVYTNHIHADDLARICRAALWYAKPQRVYHACDNSQLKMGEYFDLVAQAFDLVAVPRLTRNELAKIVSPQLLSFMSESRRLENHRMQQELRVKLRYPQVADGLQI